MKILVTGGTGNLGRCVVSELLAEDHEITVLARHKKPPADERVTFVEADVTRIEEVISASKGMEAIVHLAGGHGEVPHAPEVIELNAQGTFNVLEAAARNGIRKIVYASSDSALGFIFRERDFVLDYLPVDEQHPLKPQDAYGLSKVMGEEACKSYTRRCGMQIISLRLCWIWPPHYYDDHAKIVEESIHTFPVPSKTESLNARRLWGYVDVRDAAHACILALEAKNVENEAFLITAENTFSPESSLELIQRCYPEVKSVSREYFAGAEDRSLYDISKARKMLGYNPQYNWKHLVR